MHVGRRPGIFRWVIAILALVMGAGVLASCARISDIPLESDGVTPIPGAAPGIRHYLARPYLLVVELPASAANTGNPSGTAPRDVPPPPGFHAPPPGAGPGPGTGSTQNPGSQTQKQAPANNDSSNTPQSPPDNTSFVANTGTYWVKVIYIPDYSHPMALTMDTGLFGLASANISLQNGVILTSASLNVDNTKAGDVATALIQAVATMGAGAAPKAPSTPTKGATPPGAAPGVSPPVNVLRPGLYAFDFRPGISRVSAVCAIAYFDATGAHPTAASDTGACGPDESRGVIQQAPGAPPVVR
jgi:hypothetical protein